MGRVGLVCTVGREGVGDLRSSEAWVRVEGRRRAVNLLVAQLEAMSKAVGSNGKSVVV